MTIRAVFNSEILNRVALKPKVKTKIFEQSKFKATKGINKIKVSLAR